MNEKAVLTEALRLMKAGFETLNERVAQLEAVSEIHSKALTELLKRQVKVEPCTCGECPD